MAISLTEFNAAKDPSSGDYRIDALVDGSWEPAYWNYEAALENTYTITYAFYGDAGQTTDVSQYMTNLEAMSATQQGYVEQALAYVGSVTGITFVEASAGTQADIVFVLGDFLPAYSDAYGRAQTEGSYSYSTSGGTSNLTSIDISSVVMIEETATASFAPGTYAYQTLLHEIGHVLGLKHSFEGDTVLPAAEDNWNYTLMSYTGTGTYATTYAQYDLLALDFLYGGDGLAGSEGIAGSGGGGSGTLTGGAYTLISATLTTITGSATGDNLVLAAGNCTITVSAVETVTGSAAREAITFGGSGQTVTVSAVETLTGGTGADWITLAGAGSTVSVGAVDVLVGSAGNDVLAMSGTSQTLIVAAVESVAGTAGSDFVQLGNRGNTTTVTAVEFVLGGTGIDGVTLASTGNTVVVTAVETLTGGAGGDSVQLGNRGNTSVVVSFESIAGGAAGDTITLGASGNTVSVGGVEILLGGAGGDRVALSGSGQTITLALVETVTGSSGTDFVQLGNRGNTVVVSAVDYLLGGTGSDSVTVSGAGSTMVVAALETLVGGAGTDVVQLGNRGNTTTLSGVETVTGGTGADAVTVSSGGVTFTGGGGADSLVLAASGGDTVAFGALSDGATAGAVAGYDTVTGFNPTADGVSIGGALRSAADRNGNGTLTVTDRASGAVNAASDEVVRLTTAVADLDDAGFASFRAALGNMATGSTATVLVLANDGTSTGLYAVTDNGNGTIAASEVTLLAVFQGAVLTAADITSG